MKCLLWNWIWLASLPGMFLLIQAEGNRIPTPPPHSAFRHPQTGQNLEILQLSPGGPVTDPPNLSVSFSQPMVTFTGLKRQSQPPAGVTLTPQPAGSWFWIGPKTLVFEPETFFPMATVYQVNIGQDVRSMAGNQLLTPVAWTFSTPELRITEDNAVRATRVIAKLDQGNCGNSVLTVSTFPNFPSLHSILANRRSFE